MKKNDLLEDVNNFQNIIQAWMASNYTSKVVVQSLRKIVLNVETKLSKSPQYIPVK